MSVHPGLRFHELKKETKLANGTLQHHISSLEKNSEIEINYSDKVPRYYSTNLDSSSKRILHRLRQNTTSKIIKALLKNKCMNFAQIVSEARKSPGTVSIYKNKLLSDRIIVGDTNECNNCPKQINKIKYRLTEPEKVRTLVSEYGKSSLQQSADNLADVFLAIK